MGKTSIEWTETSWNPLRGCSRVSEGCRNCYAETVANRFKGPGMPYEGLIAKGGQWNGKIRPLPEKLEEPLRWRKPRRVFVNSMSDLFHENVPFEFIASVFSIMSVTTRHTYQILTKRPERVIEFFDWAVDQTIPGWPDDSRIIEAWPDGLEWKGYDNCGPVFPYDNIWIGVSVEDQITANERIPLLLRIPASVRWISAEPLLGPINVTFAQCTCPAPGDALRTRHLLGCPADRRPHRHCHWSIDWVVVGGESGSNARPMDLRWARALRDQCVATNTPFFFKQWGDWGYSGQGARIGNSKEKRTLFPGVISFRVGKKNAGRFLDGREWNEYPTNKESRR